MAIVLKLKIFLFITAVLLLCEMVVTAYLIANDFAKAYPIFTGVAAIPSIIVCLALYDIISLKPANSHTTKTLLSQYSYSIVCRVLGVMGMSKFKRQSKECEKLQENLLHYIIEKNKDTEYSKQMGLSKSTIFTAKDFPKNHPVTDYETFRPYVNSIVQGKDNILTAEKPDFLATTSGTTGKPKRYPILKENKKRIVRSALAMLYTHRNIYKSLKRLWQFRLMSKPTYTADGLPITGVSNIMAVPYRHNIVPDAITKIFTEYPAFYIQAIFALTEPELFYIDGFSSNLMYSFFKFLEANYTKICHDIATGSLNENVDMPQEVRKELIPLMTPNPKRAAFIKQQIELGSTGLAKRIWPELEYVHLGISAGMRMCAEALRSSYLQGIKMFQMAHGASEAHMGYQVEDDVESEVMTMLPDATAYMEFIPIEDCQEKQPKTYPMHKLKVGQQYEVVVTTVNGIYRLRFGDIIEVVGHFNSIPKYILKGRLGQQLNVAYERTPEHLFYDALCKAESFTKMPRIEEYTATESMALENLTGEKFPENYYVTFVEFAAKDAVENTALTDTAAKLDKCLCECHSSYKFTREKGHLAPVQMIEVKAGTFEKLRYKMWGECQNMQFKMPRVVRQDGLLKLLWDSQCKLSDERSVEEITSL